MKDMIKILHKVRLKNPYFISGWPGMGNVALKTASYISEELSAKEFAVMNTGNLFYPDQANISEGIIEVPRFPADKFYYWKNKAGRNDLIIFISEAQPVADKCYLYAHKVLEIAESFNARKIISFAAMPMPIEHTQKPGVWYAATDRQLSLDIKKFHLRPMDAGQISGLNGLLLSVAKERGQSGFCLLGEIPLYTIQIDNPKASLAILENLSKIIDVPISLGDLKMQVQLQEDEINRLIDYFRGGSEHKEPIGEDEIERIKKSLQSFSRLPNSIKDRIDEMFEEAKKDISKANELKRELDKWSIYTDYEDRFLDLFKDAKKKTDN